MRNALRLVLASILLASTASASTESFSITVKQPNPIGLREVLGPEPVRLTEGRLDWFVFSKWCRNDAAKEAAKQFYPNGVGPGRKCKVLAKGSKPNLITTAGLSHLAAVMAQTAEFARFHGLGTSNQATSVSDTGCIAETGSRATGSLASATATFTTVGSRVAASNFTLNEFCLMTASSGGTAWTRILTGAVSISSGATIETTYSVTVN